MKKQTSAIIRIMTPVQIRSFRNGLRSRVTQIRSTEQSTRIDKAKPPPRTLPTEISTIPLADHPSFFSPRTHGG